MEETDQSAIVNDLKSQVEHWKANHADQVRKKQHLEARYHRLRVAVIRAGHSELLDER